MASALAACAPSTGDLGRARPSPASEAFWTPLGRQVAALRNEPASTFPWTDDEAELRARTHRFLMPQDDRGQFDRALVHFKQNRLYPYLYGNETEETYLDRVTNFQAPHHQGYGERLLQDTYRSTPGRYYRIMQDMAYDRATWPEVCAVAARVRQADERRLRALPQIRERSPQDVTNVADRVAENEALIQWVDVAMVNRLKAYRYALEHLVIAIPNPAAAEAERTLLEAERAFPQERCSAMGGQNRPSLGPKAGSKLIRKD
jgi:hypothetical protein